MRCNCDCHAMGCGEICGPCCPEDEREKNWRVCAKYIRMTNDLPSAQARAKQDGISFNTSVWITAYGRLLRGRADSEMKGGA